MMFSRQVNLFFHIIFRRPPTLQDRVRDSDNDDFRDRDIDTTTLDNQHFQPRIFHYDHIEEVTSECFVIH